jgi:hypothetical protein
MFAKMILSAALLSFSNLVFAFDAPQYDRHREKHDDRRIVGMECHKKKQTLEVGYFTDYNLTDKTMDLWDVFDLKTNSSDGMSVKSVHEIIRKCNLGDEYYVIKFRPVIGNWNLNGACADTFGGATILRNGVVVFDQKFEKCGSEEVIVKVFFSKGIENPEITKIPQSKFIWDK